MSVLADGAHRDLAVRSLDRNVVVEAGAGTGKTTLLIDRLTLLLLEGGRSVERIVALTFTEKAAAEIRLRLAARLHDVLDGKKVEVLGAAASEAHKERAAAALRALDRSQIGTIHGFASHLLRLYPIEAGVDPSAGIDEGPEGDELFETEWARWLDVELAEDSPRAEAWLAALGGSELDELADLARCLAHPKVEGEGKGGASIASAIRGMAEEARRLSEANRKGEKLRKAESLLLAAADRLEGLAKFLIGASPQLDERAARKQEEELELSGKPPAGWSEKDFARAKALVKLAASADRESEARIRDACGLLAPFVRRFRSAYERRGWVSFDGLLVRSRDLVRGHRRVRLELKASFDAFLIDEFQDTDPLQGELLLYLAERPGDFAADWSKVRLAPGRLFVVGDPKQSIYRFRGADIAAFERFTGLMLEQGAARATLSVNFRSRKELLDAVNDAFPSLMVADPGSQPGYVPLFPSPASAEDGQGGGTIELLTIEGGDESADDFRDAEAEAVAAWIEAGVIDGRHKLRDVAILLRTLSPLRAYLDALKRRGLAYVVEGEKYFYQAPEVLDFFNLLNAVEDPGHSVALLGLLRSPLVGLSDAELLELKAAGALDYRRPAAGRVGRFYALLRELHADVGRRPVGDLVRRILAAPFFLELAVRGYHGEQTLANLEKFGAMAAEASDEKGLSLKEFTRRLQQDVRQLKEEGESPLADESLDAVRVMTVHKSKGLEFPVVILPNLCAAMRASEPERLRVDWETGLIGLRLGRRANAAMAALEERELGKERDEEVRVLYVAMTRARRSLLLAASGEPKAGSPAQLLARAGLWDGVRIKKASIAYQEPPRARRAAEAGRADFDARAVAERAKARAAAKAKADIPLFAAPSGDTHFRDTPSQNGDTHFGGTPSAALVGTLCHRVLQSLDFRKPLPDFEAAARRLALESPADWTSALEPARELVRVFLKSAPAAELARAEIVGREWPFIHGLEDGRVARGAADLLCRIDGRLWVVDYKTDRVSAEEAPARADAYRGQADAYVRAVQAALGERPGVKLLFLRPCVEVAWT